MITSTATQDPPREPEDDDAMSFVLLPVIGEPGAFMSVGSDGSYSRWIPRSMRTRV